MSGIDYSKWDKMDYGEASSDEEGEEETARMSGGGGAPPRVTRLDCPSKVTRDADGMITVDSSKAPPLVDGSSSKAATSPTAASDISTKAAGESAQVVSALLRHRLTKNGGYFTDTKTQSKVYWSQDRQEVIVSVEFDPKQIKSKDIRVEATGLLSYSERNVAVGSARSDGSSAKLTVTADLNIDGRKTSKVLLEGDLSHKIYLAEDEDEIDWEIHSEDNRKFIRVTLRKAVPMAGLVLWWDQVLQHCPKISVSTIEGRPKNNNAGVANVWEEAHRTFKEKVVKGELAHQTPFDTGEA